MPQTRRSVRCLSSTVPRAATPKTPDPLSKDPVSDIDVAFDYPSEAQSSMARSQPFLKRARRGTGVYGGDPVNDIDVVFDYPSQAQGSMAHGLPSLESAGLGAGMYGGRYTGKGIDDAVGSMKSGANSVKEGMESKMGQMKDTMGGMKDSLGNTMGKDAMKGMDTEMGHPENKFIYAGLGALGLAALYMKLRQPGQTEKKVRWDPSMDARSALHGTSRAQPAHAPLEKKIEKMIGRGG